MIQFFFEEVENTIHTSYSTWLEELILKENKKLGDINYILCNDDYLLKINQDFLQHDYYTDIITFDKVRGKTINADIFVSLQRVTDNAELMKKSKDEELRRVLAHGLLHLVGFKDKSEDEQKTMRSKEDFYLALYKEKYQ
ncbi:rRNA maturation RNase YbeY [Chryseobacterium sp. POL2]|uniref:rRNA maturation RNase YbeY n=1 Tax=Chryseobacterium sp. POL2 TaxID=2713414 RepID=UPI0013E1B197|nr:rRNA maturation RNase YbeY [Chryseobacterium sp. POL2]QIG90029.1 rRNA maturation RNase YbeY [Chryseobacterium sp. POL2]